MRHADYTLPSGYVSPDWLFAHPTRWIDSRKWQPEQILVPALKVGPTLLSVTIEPRISYPRLTRSQRLLGLMQRRRVQDLSCLVFDTRFDISTNLAHVLINQVARVYIALESGIISAPTEVTVVVPTRCPHYIRELWTLVGATIVASDLPIRGHLLKVEESSQNQLMLPLLGMLQTRVWTKWFGDKLPNNVMTSPRIFIPRRSSRVLTDQVCMESMLMDRGFTTYYPEDHPLPHQLAQIVNAKQIVAVHGAALAGLLFRSPTTQFDLIELFSPSYISHTYRMITKAAGSTWVGVRGKIRAKDVTINRPDTDARLRQDASLSCDASLVSSILQRIDDKQLRATPH